MCCKGKFSKTLAVILIGFCAISFSFSGARSFVNPREAQFIPICENLTNHHSFIGVECVSSNNQQTSDPLAYFFHSLFHQPAVNRAFTVPYMARNEGKKSDEIIRLNLPGNK
jgi:hypothetical protein